MAAAGATPRPGRHPLLLVSHGTGGSELGHAWLGERLARQGWVVLAVRHPGDNHEDRSGVLRSGYFVERPRQLSRALDEVLANPQWGRRLDRERIAAFGHSAGGHTVLALAGARPDARQLRIHCSPAGRGLTEDAAMCALGGSAVGREPPPAEAPRALPDARDPDSRDPAARGPDTRDPQIRAVVAVQPLAQALDAASLKALTVPVYVETAGRDEVLAPVWHGRWLCERLPQGACTDTPEAGHFAAFQVVGMRMGPPGLDPAADPEGFDRRAWQAAAGGRIERFLGALSSRTRAVACNLCSGHIQLAYAKW